jgi:superfamily II DNA or RNA helicase
MLRGIPASVTQRGLEVSKDDFAKAFGDKMGKAILRKFTISYPAPVGNYRISKKMYSSDVDRGVIIFPRFAEEALLKSQVISSAIYGISPGESIDVDFLGVPTPNQVVTADHLVSNIFDSSKGGGCTMNMRPGEGKTFLAMYVLSLLKVKTLIVVPNTYLLQQWVKCLEEFTSASVGVYYGKEKRDGDVVVGIINSLVGSDIVFTEQAPKVKGKKREPKIIRTMSTSQYYEMFGLVILDESHVYATDAFSKFYNLAQRQYMLGLSATPNEREHGLDKISHYHIGHVLDATELEGYELDEVPMAASVEIVEYHGPDALTANKVLESTGKICVPLMHDDIQADTSRNHLVILKTMDLMQDGLNIFVFCERRAHADILSDMLVSEMSKHTLENAVVPVQAESTPDSTVIMYGGAKDSTIDSAKNTATVVFTTFAYSSTGVSIDRMTGLVLASPRRSKATQVVGRIFRKNPIFNDVHRRIVDVVDKRSILGMQVSSRMPAYRSRQCEISKSVYHWRDIQC